MRTVAVVAVILAVVVVLLAVALVLQIRRRWQELDAEAAHWGFVVREQAEAYGRIEDLLRDELAQALDRVQAPEAAMAFSQSERAARTMTGQPEGPMSLDGEGNELSVGDLERATEDLLRREAEKRGIDPSELSAEAGPSSGGL